MKNLYAQARRFSNLMLLAFLALGLTACNDDFVGPQDSSNNDLIAVASGPEFTTFTAAVEAAGLTGTLRSDGPFTIFAPSDEAFAKLPESALRTLMQPQHQEKLVELLTFHLVEGRVYASEVVQLSTAKSFESSNLSFKQSGSEVYVNEARIIETDIEASNGLVHVIDTVLLPEWFGSWISRADVGLDPLANDTE